MKLVGASEREQTTRRNSCPNGRSRLPRSGDRVKALPVAGVKSGHRLPSQDSWSAAGGPAVPTARHLHRQRRGQEDRGATGSSELRIRTGAEASTVTESRVNTAAHKG